VDRIKGVVLAGGTGSRLRPLTEAVNKHLLPVGRFPMICYPIAKLVQAGILDVLVVAGARELGDIAVLLGSGGRWGARLTYRVQEEAGGIAHAVAQAEPFAAGLPIVVLLGDNIFEAPLDTFVGRFLGQGRGARVLLKEVDDPERYGVAVVDAGRVVRIEEKPRNPSSRLCVTGIYMYHPDVFGVIAGVRPSGRGELEISDVNQSYVEAGTLAYDVLPGWWVDAGTVDSLRLAGELAGRLPEASLPRPVAAAAPRPE
jgi:glucose-1-phosphate thymidylyltransferase